MNAKSYVKRFLKSSEATASGFSCVGWDTEHQAGDDIYVCWVNYGLLEEMELEIVLERGGGWYVQMYIPPVRPECSQFATHVLGQIAPETGLVATECEDGGYLLGATGNDIAASLPKVWRAYGDPRVYEAVLTLCGLTAPDEDFETYPDIDPFVDQEED